MAFYGNPTTEDDPKCIVCKQVMLGQGWEDGLVCSATCADIWLMGNRGPDYDIEPRGEFHA